jgi:alpha-ribazole phosphatase
MPIYLIRHTTPDIIKGLCYGQLDVDVTNSFGQEADAIKKILEDEQCENIFSSDLQRCTKLAKYLFDAKYIKYNERIREINCGAWEGMLWNDIPEQELMPWMNNFVETPTKNGESYLDLYKRLISVWLEHTEEYDNNFTWVVHGGVIRTILAHITQTTLQDSFNAFNIYYGAVVKIELNTEQKLQYTFLHNPLPTDKEMHKPSIY